MDFVASASVSLVPIVKQQNVTQISRNVIIAYVISIYYI